MKKPEVYYFHEESDSFFVADLKWENPIDCIKIGLTIKPGVNDIIRKIIKRFGNESFLLKQAMYIYDYDEEQKSFIDERQLSKEEIQKYKI